MATVSVSNLSKRFGAVQAVEVLLVSLEPHQLMVGKVVGLGLVGLLQMVIWVGGGSLLMSGRLSQFGLGSITLPDGFVLWALLYFLGGYFLYAALMGILGALAPNAREAGQFTFFLLPLMVPLWLNASLTASPDGPLTVALSLFPLTAPVTMMTRLAATAVPTWQLLLGVVGVLLTAYLCSWLASRFFRGDTLLSSAPLRWQRLFRGGGRLASNGRFPGRLTRYKTHCETSGYTPRLPDDSGECFFYADSK